MLFHISATMLKSMHNDSSVMDLMVRKAKVTPSI